MTANLIIFGAGASTGSGNIDTPPLGNQLFEELQRFDPEIWGRLPEENTRLFKEDFEKGMESLAQTPLIAPLQRRMAAYFFNFRPATDNLYYKLAQRIKTSQWNGAIITLNYDLLLQRSLSNVGLPISIDFPGLSYSGRLEVCLPHGSCNVVCDSVRASKGVSITGVTTQGSIKVIHTPKEFYEEIENNMFPPVMSNINLQKTTISATNFIRQQRERYNVLVDRATNIIIIGVRVRNHDKHIWGPLRQTSAKLVYCSGKTGGEEFAEWTRGNRKNKEDIIIAKCFEEAFDELMKQMLQKPYGERSLEKSSIKPIQLLLR